jgi:hypothetical protein
LSAGTGTQEHRYFGWQERTPPGVSAPFEELRRMMSGEDYDSLLDHDGREGSEREGKPAHGLLLWPWLILLGLLTIGVGVAGALTVGWRRAETAAGIAKANGDDAMQEAAPRAGLDRSIPYRIQTCMTRSPAQLFSKAAPRWLLRFCLILVTPTAGQGEKKGMSGDPNQLRQSAPDLAHLDPLSTEVQEWLDKAHEAVKRLDEVEGVILRMHQRYLLDPAEKIVASQEIVDTIDRAVRTSELISRTGTARKLTQ